MSFLGIHRKPFVWQRLTLDIIFMNRIEGRLSNYCKIKSSIIMYAIKEDITVVKLLLERLAVA